MVRLALISDIHGNFKAFEAFLAYLGEHPVDGVICLGDYVTDGPYPLRTLDLLYGMQQELPCYVIRGNREEYLLDNRDNHQGWKPSSSNGTLFYTLGQMRKEDMMFFASLPTEREVCVEGCPALYICHGTPGRVRGNVYMEEGLREAVMGKLPYSCLLGGHSHHQEIYQWEGDGQGRSCQEKDMFQKRSQGQDMWGGGVWQSKTYINPGSLGLCMDGQGRHAQFAMLTGDSQGWEAELLSISYDVEGYLRAFGESGVDEMGRVLNKAVKKSLVTGVNYFFHSVLAMEERARELGVPSASEVPEEEWERLAERFGL